MQPSIRFKVNIVGDRTIRLPEDVPEGPAEIIVFIQEPEAARERAQRAELRRRAIGTAAGHFAVPDDFDDPLPREILEQFVGIDTDSAGA